MEKINIAKILKDCPKGTLLYATVHGEVKLSRIISSANFPIEVEHNWGLDLFTEDGRMYPNKGECVLFPSKDQRDWSKFQRPFKDGDIVVTLCNSGNTWISIFKKRGAFGLVETYVDYAEDGSNFYSNGAGLCYEKDIDIQRLANEEEKEKLFKAIKYNGYRWNSENKTLEKQIKPKFKVGDKIKKNKDYISGIVTNISDDGTYKVEYQGGGVSYVSVAYQDEWELAPDKFDINTLTPFESRVLVRNSKDQYWIPAFWGYKAKKGYVTTFGHCIYCIPFVGNEHLFRTKDDCSNFYKTWE